MQMRSEVQCDDITKVISANFDYAFDGVSTTIIPDMMMPEEYSIGLIVGSSGSGKSTLLRTIGSESIPEWNPSLSIASHFETAEEAQEKLSAVGFNSIPSWLRPYHVLSTGEKFRANMARMLDSNVVIDEFTSVVDRDVAKSCAFSIQRYIRKKGLTSVTFASCHYDIIDYLQPDWVFDTNLGHFLARGSLRQPHITIDLFECSHQAWSLFSQHHYLTSKINKAARCYIAYWEGRPVGFTAVLAYPSGTVQNAWRGHRTVVLPDFQGLGIGMMISDAVGELYLKKGCRYFSKTSHPRMGEYRNNSPKWKPTTKNEKKRLDYDPTRRGKESKYKMKHAHRHCYSHEYIGLDK